MVIGQMGIYMRMILSAHFLSFTFNLLRTRKYTRDEIDNDEFWKTKYKTGIKIQRARNEASEEMAKAALSDYLDFWRIYRTCYITFESRYIPTLRLRQKVAPGTKTSNITQTWRIQLRDSDDSPPEVAVMSR